jgi:hypothetical protein
VRFGDLRDDRVLERAGVAAVAVEGDAADRRPRRGEDPALGAEGLDLGLGEVRVLPTDPLAAMAIAERVGVPRRLTQASS